MNDEGPRQGAALAAKLGTRVPDLLLVATSVLYMAAVLRTAWVGDDAFITLRAVDNFVHGFGLVSNPPERVLGFTDPLWALLLSLPMALGIGGYAAALIVSVIVSAMTAELVLLHVTGNRWAAIVAGLWMTVSAAYVDFSTSGLENPLAHLLLALFFSAFLAEKLSPARVSTWALAALIVVNRQDHVLLVAPALLVACLGRPLPPTLRAAVLGSLPLIAWLTFALVYYGFPFPNTAYAKLNVHLPDGALLEQGYKYLAISSRRDPITLIAIGLAVAQLARDRSREALATAGGIALYLAYVLRIGGDFMAGRFLTAPFLIALVWLAQRGLSHTRTRSLQALALCSAALLFVFPVSFRSAESTTCTQHRGIVSERHCYRGMALVDNVSDDRRLRQTKWIRGARLREAGQRVAVISNVGMLGYAAGPAVHIVDVMALTDPLLARIPFRSDKHFRIGHFKRALPTGYAESLRSGRNQIEPPCLHAYYAVLSRVIRGPLFTRERWRAIWDLNRGEHDDLVQPECLDPVLKRRL